MPSGPVTEPRTPDNQDLHLLEYVHDPAYRRTIHHMLSRAEVVQHIKPWTPLR
jgi:hypothetical protein